MQLLNCLVITAISVGSAQATAIRLVKVDPWHRLWVREPRAVDARLQRWAIYTAEGRALARLDAPAAFEIQQIGPDFLLGKSRGELDVEFIQLNSLTTPGTQTSGIYITPATARPYAAPAEAEIPASVRPVIGFTRRFSTAQIQRQQKGQSATANLAELQIEVPEELVPRIIAADNSGFAVLAIHKPTGIVCGFALGIGPLIGWVQGRAICVDARATPVSHANWRTVLVGSRIVSMSEHLRFGTLAVHAGQTPDESTGAIMPPIYQTSTYVQPKLGEPKRGYEYARVQNPTREAMEANIAALEGGVHGMAFASGMAAIEAITKRLSSGDHVIYEENVYGGTHRMFVQVLSRFGLQFTALDLRDLDAVRAAIRPNTKLIHIETPTNPMMRVSDLRAIVQLAHEREIQVAVDNTFASPYNQRPIDLGADMVVHSSTKYLNGHSDVIGGIVVTSDEAIASDLRFLQKATGGVPGPWDSWLVLRGTKTLHLRMQAHNANGQRVAEYLEKHKAIEAVHYPGLPSHPQHELAKCQMRGFTGMVSFEVGSLERATRIAESTRLFALAESLGGVESLIGHPAIMTHASVPKDMRDRMGVSDGLLRLSVGIEDVDDLIEDLDNALKKA